MASKKHDTNNMEVSWIVRMGFVVLMFVAEVLLCGALGLCIYWVLGHRDGIAWEKNKTKQFNLHYILMIGGTIFLNGQAILVYKLFPCCKKIYGKVVHTIIFVMSVSSITVGLVSAIQARNNDINPKHFYSIHSWIGLTTIGLFALQLLFGFFTFLVFLCCETATAKFRQRLLPTHITFGLIVFSLAIASCVTGLTETTGRIL
ncbi:probable ascorbate-specific transmembrane electron transporter 1 [Centruroides sculpturatus]|uniref:probable ascorbate-specific transmembrane electron transporter 1 n=1 Tax=Centruroides sculpturatus TaxID=218467 RepID=UPI000C6E3521|nr:probable ascorbate-specific transmembrane electron transporter 1 [Centruroides sculpturatus]